MNKIDNISWPDRMALMTSLGLTKNQAMAKMGQPEPEWDTALDLVRQGVIVPTSGLDVAYYADLLETETSPASPTSTSIKRPTTPSAETATKKITAPKKRGRKGDKIKQAFSEIPSTPVPVDAYAADHGVSVAVLRQSKRFCPNGTGSVKVKNVAAAGSKEKTLMIWREVK